MRERLRYHPARPCRWQAVIANRGGRVQPPWASPGSEQIVTGGKGPDTLGAQSAGAPVRTENALLPFRLRRCLSGGDAVRALLLRLDATPTLRDDVGAGEVAGVRRIDRPAPGRRRVEVGPRDRLGSKYGPHGRSADAARGSCRRPVKAPGPGGQRPGRRVRGVLTATRPRRLQNTTEMNCAC